MTPRPLAVITGASEGLGRDFATLYAEDGHDVVLVARREAPLRALASELASRCGVACQVVVADLATREGCDAVLRRGRP